MDFKLNKSNLNINVYTAAAFPDTAQENDICIISDAPMKNWILSPAAPSGAPRTDGDVWIQYSVTGTTFNALKNGHMMIATTSANQYVDGAWVDKEAKIYQNGKWVDWVVYLFNKGNQCESVTGGWTSNGYTHPSITIKPATFDDTKMVFDGTSGQYKILGTGNAISLSGKNQIRVIGEVTSVYSANGAVFGLVLSVLSTKSFSNFVAELVMNKVGKFDYTLDVSDLDGGYYIVIRAEAAGGCNGYVTEVCVN